MCRRANCICAGASKGIMKQQTALHRGALPFLRSLALASVVLTGCVFSSDVRRAEQLAASGDWDGAVAAYREAVRKDPHDPDLQQRLDYAKATAAEQHYTE